MKTIAFKKFLGNNNNNKIPPTSLSTEDGRWSRFGGLLACIYDTEKGI